ncbi:hypothetical protein RSOLAG22IIIB_12468 [Rhizoctonia solani]|uniref:F-box domain-containing protein n=1 Tax=Rhizoctonia solani TaxID=456999 RepID=A0A0K6GEH0_9AGAM|nr:hypothetical protein RSOLAG22IIIB_12468 [Rhizoctonia solani]
MGTRGYTAYRYKGKYYRKYIKTAAYPKSCGLGFLWSIPRKPEALKNWKNELSKKLLKREEEACYESSKLDGENICTDSNWTLGAAHIQWTYVIDLDNHVFTVNGLLHFKLDNLPPLKRSGSELEFVDYFCEDPNGGSLPKIPEEHLTSLEFWPQPTFDAEKAQQEYTILQLRIAALSEWNAPKWGTLSVAQHLSISLIKTLIEDYSDELALCYYSATWTKLSVFRWNVANAAATSHLLCPPPPRVPCHDATSATLDEPAYMTHEVVRMVQHLRKNGRTEGVGIIMSGWHVMAVTVHGSDVRHSPVLDLHDGKEPKDGALLLMHLLSPAFTRSKAPWITSFEPHNPSYSNRPNVPEEVLRQIIYLTDFETYACLSKVSHYFRSIYLAEPRIGNYTLFAYEGVSPNSETIFRVRGIDSTDSRLAILTRVKTSLDPTQKALLLHRYDWDFDLTDPILQPGLGGMFQYHKSGSKRSSPAATEEIKESSAQVHNLALEPISLLDVAGRKNSATTMRVQALDGIWKMVGVNG